MTPGSYSYCAEEEAEAQEALNEVPSVVEQTIRYVFSVITKKGKELPPAES